MDKQRERAFVLLPGGGMGAWIWERLTPLLDRRSLAVEGRIAAPPGWTEARALRRATIRGCAAYVAGLIDAEGVTDAVLVAHSGSGVIAPFVAEHTSAVRHIVFIAANIPPEGGTALDGLPFGVRLMNVVAIRLFTKPVPARKREKVIREHFVNASPEDVIECMLDKDIRPEPPCAAFERVHRQGLPRIPATYVKCLRDGTLSAAGFERMIANYGGMESVEIDADHMVMLSRPRELAAALNAVAARALG
jgi:pimeloyl-ACP methyl ester carboxylesterase